MMNLPTQKMRRRKIMMQKNSKDNKIEIRDLGKIAVSEMLD